MPHLEVAGATPAPRIRHRTRRRTVTVGMLLVGLLSSTLSGVATAQSAEPLFTPIRIDQGCEAGCTAGSLSEPNSSRKLAVAPDGTILATFRATEGIFVARSTDRGQSFGTPQRVTSAAAQPAIAASSSGATFVAWVETGTAYVARSEGDSWSTPVAMGSTSSDFEETVHLAVDGDHVYAIDRAGTRLFRSDDAGATFTTTTVSAQSWVFSDVHVDPLTRDVYVIVDNPSVSYYRSTDHGVSFGAAVAVPAQVYYSVAALTSTPQGAVAYVAGMGTNLERIDLSDGTVQQRTVDATSSTTRSLGADAFGNVVSGSVDGGMLSFQVSTDLGATFSDSITIGEGIRANASINTTNGDVLFLHEVDGEVRLAVYGGLLDGYGVIVDRSAVSFTTVGESRTVTITNTSNEPQPVVEIAVGEGDPFDIAHACGGTLAAGASCTITITPTAHDSGVLSIQVGDVVRDLPLTFSTVYVAPVPLDEPAVGTVEPTADGYTVAVTNHDPDATYTVTADVGTATLQDGVITVTGLEPGTAATVTITVTKDGATPATTTVTGRAADAPVPTPSPTQPVPDAGGSQLPAPRSGSGSATIAGDDVDTRTSRTATGFRATAGGLEFELTVTGTPLASSTVANAPYLIASSSDLSVEASGLQPGSTARVWVFSEQHLLGTVPVDAEGRVSTTDLSLPDAVTACSHTVQLSGLTAAGDVAGVNLGVTIVPEPFPFRDVAIAEIHAASIGCAEDQGIVRGYTDGRFLPIDGLQRGQFASMLARSLDLDVPSQPSRYHDVAGSTHADAIAALETVGFIRGFDDGTFRPGRDITRGQVASILAAASELDLVADGAFSDVDGSTHGGAINALVGTGVIEGYADGTFRPNQPVRRAQAASLFVRYLGL